MTVLVHACLLPCSGDCCGGDAVMAGSVVVVGTVAVESLAVGEPSGILFWPPPPFPPECSQAGTFLS
jgi:hypothetical protein